MVATVMNVPTTSSETLKGDSSLLVPLVTRKIHQKQETTVLVICQPIGLKLMMREKK